MKKYILFVFSFVLLFTNIAHAQTAYQIYVHDITSDKSAYQVGDTVNGNFAISNLSNVAQSDIYYTISSGKYDNKSMTVLDTLSVSDKIGPKYIKANSKENISFSYKLPSSLSGSAAIQITAILKDGTLVGQSDRPISISGSSKKEIGFVDKSYLNVSGMKDSVPLQTGPVVYKGEKIKLTYFLSPTKSVYSVKPTLKLYDRTENNDSLKKSLELDSIKTDAKSIAHVVELPSDLDPLVYYGVLSFESDKIDISPVNLRYIIAGPIATVRNITTDTLEVKKGGAFSAVVSYSGRPIDQFRLSNPTGSSTLTNLTVTATNENNETIATETKSLDLQDPAQTISIPLIALVSAKSINFSSTIKTAEGKILDEYKTSLPTSNSVKNQQSYLKPDLKPTNLYLIIAVVVALLALIILIIFLRKKKKNLTVPLVVLVFAILVIAKFWSASDAKAWEYYGTPTGNRYYHFNVTSVVSPLPPEIKIYEPGESFNFKLSASFLSCNNKPWDFATYLSRVPDVPSPEDSLYDLVWEATQVGTLKEMMLLYNLPNTTEQEQTDVRKVISVLTPGYNTHFASTISPWSAFNWMTGQPDPVVKTKLNDARDLLTQKGFLTGNASSFDFISGTAEVYMEELCEECGLELVGPQLQSFTAALQVLSTAALNYATPYINGYVNSVDWGSHAGNTFYSTVQKSYIAPTTPGFHTYYGKIAGSNNEGWGIRYFSQKICVRGAGVCPNESADMPIQITASASDEATTTAKINWIYTSVKPQINYEVDVYSDPDYNGLVAAKMGTGDVNLPLSNYSIYNNVRSVDIDGLAPNTTYYARVSAVNTIVDETTYKYFKWSVPATTTFTTLVDPSQSSSLTCLANPDPVATSTQTTFTAYPVNNSGTVNYLWSGAVTGSGSSKSTSFSSPGNYLASVTGTDGSGAISTVSCGVRAGCDNSHIDGATECPSGTEYQWRCQGTSWVQILTGNSCGEGGSGTSTTVYVDCLPLDGFVVASGTTKTFYKDRISKQCDGKAAKCTDGKLVDVVTSTDFASTTYKFKSCVVPGFGEF